MDNPGDILVEHTAKLKKEIMQGMTDAYVCLKVPEWLEQEWARTCARAEFITQTFHKRQSTEELTNEIDSVTMKLELFYLYFKTPKWQLWRKRSLDSAIRSSLPDVEMHEDSEMDNSIPD